MSEYKRKIVTAVVLAVVLVGVGGYLVYTHFTSQTSVEFEPYTCTFHLLFEDELRSLLGNLTGELRIFLSDKSVRSTLKLTLSSPEHRQPYIEKVQILTGYTFLVYGGPYHPAVPPPIPRNITIRGNEQITLLNRSIDIRGYKDPRICFGFKAIGKFDGFTIPTIWVYLSNGQVWKWEAQYSVTEPFPLWSGIRDWKPSELSGKSETATITLTIKSQK